MKYVAAYLLAVLGGNTAPTADDLKSILGSVGADAEDDRIERILSQTKGRDVNELIAAGMEKMASSLPCAPAANGGAAGAPAANGGAAAPPTAAAKKKEEEAEVVEEGESDDNLDFFDLFG
ncbi:60S acidic ribosomal protein P2 [Linum grandiflorum]